MSITDLHQKFLHSTGVCTDTRQIEKGCLYFALKGENFDGNEFALQALKKGAQWAIVDSEIDKGNPCLIKVENALKTLQNLATFHIKYLGIPTLGITGSNGKTTTKELIGAVLKSTFNVLITQGNLNNHIGVPLTILKGTKANDIAIIEMGANHPGDIKELCEIADPEVGLITNIGKAHLEGFGNLQGVISAKGELFEHLNQRNGKILLNLNQPLIAEIPNGNPHLTYGSTANCDIQGKAGIKCGHLKVTWRAGNEPKYRTTLTHLVGAYNLDNVLSAIAVGVYFDVPLEKISKAIADYSPSNNRSEFKEIGSNRIIWDAYNANPSSMEAALNALSSFEAENLVLILGEMKEVGNDETLEHNLLITQAKSLHPNRLVLVGSAFKHCKTDNCDFYKNVDDLMSDLKNDPIEDSLILIKGSRSNQLEKLKSIFNIND